VRPLEIHVSVDDILRTCEWTRITWTWSSIWLQTTSCFVSQTVGISSQKKCISDNKKTNFSKICLLLQNQLCGLGVRPGMECMPLRSPTGPYNHYHHVADQTKSLQVSVEPKKNTRKTLLLISSKFSNLNDDYVLFLNPVNAYIQTNRKLMFSSS
jgi:hypothetical protein